ncbi:MAG: NAD-dependent deacylase [Betaproteobacteria bacterium]|nr:NAD-dependent deacylase [Betaproteobacteria bacterium]
MPTTEPPSSVARRSRPSAAAALRCDNDAVNASLAIPVALAAALRAARFVAVLTGAGVSAESGVPTFRDAQQGLWAQFDPLELATPSGFARNPRRVWDWYAMRREMVGRVAPNPGHFALAALERRVPEFLLATQNVDGLHQRAGSARVVELHGNITRVRCSREGTVIARWDAGDDAAPPRCPQCGAFLRPDVVWFEELLPPDALAAAESAARRCDVLIVAGTSAEVYPAAALPDAALSRGARVVEVNPSETPLSAHADDVLRGPAGAVLPALVAAAFPAR